jgi:hypothetical protein
MAHGGRSGCNGLRYGAPTPSARTRHSPADPQAVPEEPKLATGICSTDVPVDTIAA